MGQQAAPTPSALNSLQPREAGAPKGTILELFFMISCQSCHRLALPLDCDYELLGPVACRKPRTASTSAGLRKKRFGIIWAIFGLV